MMGVLHCYGTGYSRRVHSGSSTLFRYWELYVSVLEFYYIVTVILVTVLGTLGEYIVGVLLHCYGHLCYVTGNLGEHIEGVLLHCFGSGNSR